MKANVKVASAKSADASVEGIEVTVEYTVEEMLALISAYPEIINNLMKLREES